MKLGTALVVYMGVGSAAEIRDNLLNHGHRASCPVDVIASAGHPEETCLKTTLHDLDRDLIDAKITNPAILLIRNPKSATAETVLPLRAAG